jgi:hypothetical protein
MVEDSIEKIAKIQNEYMKRRFSTKYSQYNYDNSKLQYLNKISFTLLMLYFIIAAVYLGILFVGPGREDVSYFYKLLALIVLVLYPFLITPIEYFSFRAIVFIVETVFGKVFEQDDYEFLIDFSHLPV